MPNITIVFPALGGLEVTFSSAPDVVPLGDDLVQATLRFARFPLLRMSGQGFERVGVPAVTAPPKPYVLSGVFQKLGPDRWEIRNASCPAKLASAAAQQLLPDVFDGDQEVRLTADGLVILVPQVSIAPSSETPNQLIPVQLNTRGAEGTWQYRILGGRADFGGSVGLTDALVETFGKVSSIAWTLRSLQTAASPMNTEWRALRPDTLRGALDWNLRLGGTTVSISGWATSPDSPTVHEQAFTQRPQWLSARFDDTHVRYRFIETNEAPGDRGPDALNSEAPDVVLQVTQASWPEERQPIRARLETFQPQPVVVVPHQADALPGLWLQTDRGWLNIDAVQRPPEPQRAWWSSTFDIETRVVSIGEWLADGTTQEVVLDHGLRIDALLDNTRATIFELELDRVSASAGNIARLKLFGAALRIATGAHAVESSALGVRSVPPLVPAHPLVLETRLTDEAPIRAALTGTLRGSVNGRPRFQLVLDAQAFRAATHWRRFDGFPLTTPVEWAANDPLATTRPSTSRGLVPLRLAPGSALTLTLRRGPPGVVESGGATLWDPERDHPWAAHTPPVERVLQAVSPQHLGVELVAAPAEGARVGAWARVRHAVPQLDGGYRAMRPAGLEATATAGLEQVVDRFADGGARVLIEDLDALWAPQGGVRLHPRLESSLAARRQPRASAEGAPLETLTTYALSAGAQGELGLVVHEYRDVEGGVRRWALTDVKGAGTPMLAGIPLVPLALTAGEGGARALHVRWGSLEDDTHALVLRLAPSPSGEAVVVEASLEGRVVIDLAQMGYLVPTEDEALVQVESESVRLAQRNGSWVLVLEELRFRFEVGADVFVHYTTHALVRPLEGGPTVWVSGKDPLQLSVDGGRLHLAMDHRLPGLIMQETLAGAPYRLRFSYAEAASTPLPADALEIRAMGNSLYVTGADVIAEPVESIELVDGLRCPVRRLTRCFLLLERSEGLWKLQRGFMGWWVRHLFGLEPAVPDQERQHLTMTIVDSAVSALTLSGLWTVTRTLQGNARSFRHHASVALREVEVGLDERQLDRLTLAADWSFPVVVLHTLSSGAKVDRWSAVQTARRRGDRLDLSGVFALRLLRAQGSGASLDRYRPGIEVEIGAPVALADTVEPRLVALPLVVPSPGPVTRVDEKQVMLMSAVGSKPEGWGGELTPVAGWNSVAFSQDKALLDEGVPARDPTPEGLDRITSRASTLCTRSSDGAPTELAWVPCDVTRLEARGPRADAEPPTLWVLGDGGIERMYQFERLPSPSAHYQLASPGTADVASVRDATGAGELAEASEAFGPEGLLFQNGTKLKLPLAFPLRGSKPVTVELRLRVSDVSGVLFRQGASSLWVGGGNVRWHEAGCVLEGSVPRDGWTHIALVREPKLGEVPGVRLALLVDGVRQQSAESAILDATEATGSWVIGETVASSIDVFAGTIAEVRITGSALLGRLDERAQRILAGARWHEVAVLERRVGDRMRWSLVDSPLLNRSIELGFFTGSTMPVTRPAIATGTPPCELSEGDSLASSPRAEIETMRILGRSDEPEEFSTADVAEPEGREAVSEEAHWVPPYWTTVIAASEDRSRETLGSEDSVTWSIVRRQPFRVDFDDERPFGTASAAQTSERMRAHGTRPPWWVPPPPGPLPSESRAPLADVPLFTPPAATRGSRAFVPRAVRLCLRAARPGEYTAARVALLVERSEGSRALSVAPEFGFLERAPLARDDQEHIDCAYARLSGVTPSLDGTQLYRAEWTRRHPEVIDYTARTAVALAVHGPGAVSIRAGGELSVRAFLFRDALAAMWSAPLAVAGQQVEALQLVVASPGQALGAMTLCTRADPLLTEPHVERDLIFVLPAAGAWTVEVQAMVTGGGIVKPPPGGVDVVGEKGVEVSGAVFEPPPALTGLFRSDARARMQLVCYGSESQPRWTAHVDAGAVPRPVIGWRKSAKIVERLPADLEAVSYQAFSVASDGSFSTSR